MKGNKLRIKLNLKKGFSIGEVMLSVFIMGVTLLAIFTLYSQGLRDFQDERDSVIASMLAQEGVEIARNIRDNNWAKRSGVTSTTPNTFDFFDVASGDRQTDCRVSFNTRSLVGDEVIYSNGVSCDNASYVLNVDTNGFYTHDSGAPTKFRRRMTLDYSDSENLIVTSFVSWDNSDPSTTTSGCTISNKCVFSQSTLTEWGTGT